MPQAGWIKVHRRALDSVVWGDPKRIAVWMTLLLRANHEDQISIDGEVIQRGQAVIGLHEFSRKTGVSIQSTRTILEKLEKCRKINKRSNKRGTVVTICNYDSYQIVDDEPNKPTNKQLTNNQQTANKQPTTIKNDKEVKKERRRARPNKFKHPTLQEVTAYCSQRDSAVDPCQFHDYYTARDWKLSRGQPMRDWQAAVRTWERNELQRNGKTQQLTTQDIFGTKS